MKIKNIREGLAILADYFDDPDGCHIGAEDDLLLVYATDKPLPAESVEKLISLGWHQGWANFSARDYQPDDVWYAGRRQ